MTAVWIGVNYGSDDETRQWVDAVLRQSDADSAQVVVVDNTTRRVDDDFGKRLCEKPGRIQWMPTPENLGYFGAARFGLDRFLRGAPLPEWVVVSNVDLRFADASFHKTLYALSLSEDVGVVAPSIRSALTGREQNPYMITRPSALRMRWIQWATQTPGRLALYEMGSRFKAQCAGAARGIRYRTGGRVVYAPHGACILFRKRYFEAGGTLDYPCFLFGEEIFVAETARDLGMTVRYVPELKIIHQEHVTTGIRRTQAMARDVATATAHCAHAYFAPRHRRPEIRGRGTCASG